MDAMLRARLVHSTAAAAVSIFAAFCLCCFCFCGSEAPAVPQGMPRHSAEARLPRRAEVVGGHQRGWLE